MYTIMCIVTFYFSMSVCIPLWEFDGMSFLTKLNLNSEKLKEFQDSEK